MSKHYTIGQLAKKANVGTVAIRYYKKRGLISNVGRSASRDRKVPLDECPILEELYSDYQLQQRLTQIH